MVTTSEMLLAAAQIDALERSVDRFVEEADKREVGVFIPIPKSAADQFPDKSDEDASPPHITILYAGNLSEAQTRVFIALTRAVASAFAEFPVEMTDYGEFINDKEQTIAHMIPRSSSLELLHRAIRDACKEASLPIEHMPGFKSHATLAYVPKGERYGGPKPTAKWTVRSIEVWDGEEKTELPLGAPAVFRASAFDSSPWVSVGNEHKLSDLVQPLIQGKIDTLTEACALEAVSQSTLDARVHDRALDDLSKSFGKISVLSHLAGRADALDAVDSEPISRFNVAQYAVKRSVSKRAQRLAAMVNGDVETLLKAYVEKYGASPAEQERIIEKYALGRGFEMARTTSDAIRKHARDLVLMASAGVPQPDIVDLIKSLRKNFTTSYSKLVVHNGVCSAYSAGRFRVLQDPAVAERVAGLEFVAVDDDRTRPGHLAADGMFATIDSPVWNDLTPPLGHWCRCSVRIVTKSEAARRGLKPVWSPPRNAVADDGWGARPDAI